MLFFQRNSDVGVLQLVSFFNLHFKSHVSRHACADSRVFCTQTAEFSVSVLSYFLSVKISEVNNVSRFFRKSFMSCIAWILT